MHVVLPSGQGLGCAQAPLLHPSQICRRPTHLPTHLAGAQALLVAQPHLGAAANGAHLGRGVCVGGGMQEVGGWGAGLILHCSTGWGAAAQPAAAQLPVSSTAGLLPPPSTSPCLCSRSGRGRRSRAPRPAQDGRGPPICHQNTRRHFSRLQQGSRGSPSPPYTYAG